MKVPRPPPPPHSFSWGGGLIHAWTHSYNPLIAFSLVAVLMGMIPFLVVPALRR